VSERTLFSGTLNDALRALGFVRVRTPTLIIALRLQALNGAQRHAPNRRKPVAWRSSPRSKATGSSFRGTFNLTRPQ
jgi:hypothetical protein